MKGTAMAQYKFIYRNRLQARFGSWATIYQLVA